MTEPNSEGAIKRINSVRRRAVTVTLRPPTAGCCSACSARLHVVTTYTALNTGTIVLDGLSSTLHACLKDHLFWIHEVGGIANVNRWLGPVPAEANELQEIIRTIQESQKGSP